jgi:hypothetical protein
MERLFDAGKRVAYIRGDAHWMISERTKTLLLRDWTLLEARPRDRDEYFESIDFRFSQHR